MNKAEKFILENTKDGSSDIIGWGNNGLPIYTPWLTPDQAKRAIKIAREEIYEWLQEHSQEYVYWMDDEFGKDDLINDLKQAIRNEA